MTTDLRRLIVMRHAKSSRDSGAETDHDRPLNKRGRRDAPRVAKHLAEVGWSPDFLLSSDAVRTRETLEFMYEEFSPPVPFAFFERLYLGGYKDLLEVSHEIPTTAGTVLALGHNPGCEEIAAALTGESVIMKTATCALVSLATSADWTSALKQRGRWTLHALVYPRDL